MQYMLLIYTDDAATARLEQTEVTKMMSDYGTFTQSIIAAGQFKAGDRLRPIAEAKTVRLHDGRPTVTDGPFAETREQLGGYYLVEAKDVEEATSIATRIPGARYGSVEVRPVWLMEQR